MPTLSELFPEMFPPTHQVVDSGCDSFAHLWLREAHHDTACTEPVIAVVRELAATLRHEQLPAPRALQALRRAIALLTVLAGSGRAVERRPIPTAAAPVTKATAFEPVVKRPSPGRESTRFAKAWLFGNPAEAIRTEPVIAIVEQLLDDLTIEKPAAAYISLRQAVQVLSVFAREDDNTTSISQPAHSTTK